MKWEYKNTIYNTSEYPEKNIIKYIEDPKHNIIKLNIETNVLKSLSVCACAYKTMFVN